jgi:WD40 repeat protein
VAWSPDGQTLASCSADQTVRLWDAAGQARATLRGHSDYV